VKSISIPAFELRPVHSIWNSLPTPIRSPQPKPMEALDQNQGLMVYKTTLVGRKSGTLTLWEPHDYALVFLNGQFIDTVYRDGGKWSVTLPVTDVKDPVLEIMVEGMGHINFAQFMIDRKGITDRVTLNGMTLMNWEMYPLPLDEVFIKKIPTSSTNFIPTKEGNFFTGEFTLQEIGDTFIDMSHFKKGIVYVNGHNLGRYWNIGPQQQLYCPAEFLKKGKNEIVVFDFWLKQPALVSGKKFFE
jgi:beta-galactosidase